MGLQYVMSLSVYYKPKGKESEKENLQVPKGRKCGQNK